MTTSRWRNNSSSSRKQEILAVASRLFSERGYDGTSMEDIAADLGMLKGSLYYWIQSKEDLLNEVLALNPTLEEIAEARTIVAQDCSATERFRMLVRCHIDAWMRYPENASLFFDLRNAQVPEMETYIQQRDELNGVFKELIRQGNASGEFRVDESDISIVVNSLFGVLNWFPRWYREDGPIAPPAIADVMANFLIAGLAEQRRPGAPPYLN